MLYCRDRNEFCEYTEPTRLRVTRIQSDNDEGLVHSDVGEVVLNECEIVSNQRQNDPLQHKVVDHESCKSDFFQLSMDPSTTSEQMNILKRLYNEIMRNPEDPKLSGNKRDELCTKLKILSSSNDSNINMKIQIWNDLCSLVNELDKIITGGDSTIMDSSFLDYNSWNSETLGFSSPVIPTNDIFSSNSTTPKSAESQGSILNFTTDLNSSTVLSDPQPVHETVQSARKNKKIEIKNVKKTNNSKKRKNQRGNKRTQPYPAGGQIVIRPTKQAHTMIWHQNDPIDDVPIMAFHIQAQFQAPHTFAHYVPSIPIDLWDHSTTMTMLSPEPNSAFSEPNNDDILPITNSILLSPTPSLHDDIGDIVSSPSNSSIDHNHMRAISDDETERFEFTFTQSTGSPQSFTMEDFNFIEMYSNTSDDLSSGMVELFGNFDDQK
ncbi:11319_t:CDS:2 [Funneliformis mosseae]|uniref:11319_t:CDS:1 n=1 Tax=Funneliformis mosseae TaxID=27381 RepID=A0A9N8WCH1_FUNMO|nr:11319_t:CDS:2 [Funneliformis mosseae]